MINILHVAAIAAQLGTVVPDSVPVPAMPRTVPITATRRDVVASGPASGNGWVSGSAYMSCTAPNGGSGWMNGSVNLTGVIPVSGPDGVSGNIPVSGFAFLGGSCQDGQGFVSGSATVDGWGTLYGRDGKPAGTARVMGTVFINQYAFGSFLYVNQNASVTGSFTAN